MKVEERMKSEVSGFSCMILQNVKDEALRERERIFRCLFRDS